MKKSAIFLILTLLAAGLWLSGCRTRTVAAPGLVDTVLQTTEQTPAQPSAPPETPDPPEETPPPPEEPQLEPAEEPPPEPDYHRPVEELTQADAEAARPDTVNTLSQSGAAQLQERPTSDVTVTYDSNGGDTDPVSTVVHTGGSYGIQPEALRRGYAFAGWWTLQAGGDQIFPDTTVTQEAAHTLYAHWQEKPTSTITFDGNGGRVKTREAHLELSDGDVYGAMPTPLREGYGFNGWSTAPEGGVQILEDSVFRGTDDLTLYAQWTYDPYEFWSFTLRNKTQQIYLCQQVSIYLELEQDNLTAQSVPLISATGSLNIAENRAEAATTDEWVLGKNPQVVIKCVSDMGGAPAAFQAVKARFPEQEVLIVSGGALDDGGSSALYAKLALAKHLYGDWYADVDLDLAAEELGVTERPVYF